jgi:hypothetical protein
MSGAGVKYLRRVHDLRSNSVWSFETWDERRQNCDEVTGDSSREVLYFATCLVIHKP